MRTKRHAFIRRNLRDLGLAFVALGCFSLAQAQTPVQYREWGWNAFDAMEQRLNGNSSTYGPGNAGGTLSSASTSRIDMSGFQYAGNFGTPKPATGPTITLGANVAGTVNGSSVALKATATATRAGVMAGFGKIAARAVLPGVASMLLEAAVDAMLSPSGVSVNRLPDGQIDPNNPFKKAEILEGYSYVVYKGSPTEGRGVTACDAVRVSVGKANGLSVQIGRPQDVMTVIECMEGGAAVQSQANPYYVIPATRIFSPIATYKYGNWDVFRPDVEVSGVDAAEALKWQLEAAKRAEKNGIDLGWKVPVSVPTITGPNSLPETTKVANREWTEAGPDGSPVTKQETKTTTTQSPLTYDGDKVKVVPKETTTTTTKTINPDGSSTTDTKTETTTEESNEPPPETSDFCKQNPDVLACSKPDLDTPDGEIPKSTKNVQYVEEAIWGSGSCPADKVVTLHTGQSLKVWDYAKTCQVINAGVAPVFLLAAAYSAFLILALGKADL